MLCSVAVLLTNVHRTKCDLNSRFGGPPLAYLFIAIILLAIVLPIFSVLPSGRQRKQMNMRQAARAAGVSVELTTIDDPNPEQDKYISQTGRVIPARLKVVGYRIQRPRQNDWRQLSEIQWSLKRNLDGSWLWSSSGGHLSRELKNFLEEAKEALPEDVEQVEESSYSIVVYWHERTPGSEANVLKFLLNCADLPLYNASS